MSARLLSVRPETPLADAAALLAQQGVDSVPVVALSGEVVGVLSHRELLRHLVPAYVQRVNTGERAERPPALVRDAMARNVLCVSEDQTVADVAHLLATKEVDRVPVVKDGVLRGVLTRADIVRKVLGT